MNEETRFLLGLSQVKRTIRNKVKKDKDIVHGGHALNAQVIGVARIPTIDYDVYTRASPKRRAIELDGILDRRSGGDNYDVKQAKHKGTYKVFHRRTETTVADYSRRPNRPINTRIIRGVKYVALRTVKKRRETILKKKSAMFRHHQDKEAIHHIKISDKIKKVIKR